MERRWVRTYLEIVSDGNRAWIADQYFEAGVEYWLAAFVAPTVDDETRMLEWCWQATERAQGRVSELEKAA